ncbi:unnamed protein product, partial [Lymnaea stagnalis]
KVEDINLFGVNRRASPENKGTQQLVCKQKPLELGIVLDSSSSIATKDFQTGIKFLQDFLQHFDIGPDPNDVRVSIITYGNGTYPDRAFNLNTYRSKEGVISAIGNITHMAGDNTDTGLAIKYMREAQLAKSVVRTGVARVGLVITDGKSQDWLTTNEQSQFARADGITMFAIGVGRSVNKEELIKIAGNESRVTNVSGYDSLKNIINTLADEICIMTPEPTTLPLPQPQKLMTTTLPPPQPQKLMKTTLPPPQPQKLMPTTSPPDDTPCCIKKPADVYFVFSQMELGLEATEWTAVFISETIDARDMINGFRYGVISGSCPDDAGFALNAYDNVADIRAWVQSYKNRKLPSLVKNLAARGYTEARGARAGVMKVAVIVANSGMNLTDLQAEVNKLVADGVKVFIADPTGKGVSVSGVTILTERLAGQQSNQLVTALCASKENRVML